MFHTAYGAVPTRVITVYVPSVFQVYMYGKNYDLGTGQNRLRVALARARDSCGMCSPFRTIILLEYAKKLWFAFVP